MDKLRAQIHTLTLQLEDERSRHVTAVSVIRECADLSASKVAFFVMYHRLL